MTDREIAAMYDKALKKAVKENKEFLKTYDDVMKGKIKPPQYYVDRDEVDKWRQGFLREKMRQEAVIERISNALDEVGGVAAETIRDDNQKLFRDEYGETVKRMTKECGEMGIQTSFAQFSKEQIKILIDDESPVFTKIAYRNLGNNKSAVKRLKSELAQSIMNGESQSELVNRLIKVVGYTKQQAERTAQTERGRVQSMARNNVGEQCRALGIVTERTWICHFLPPIKGRRGTGSRDSHKALHGVKTLQGQKWKTINGAELSEPFDPKAPANETINCHCQMITHPIPPSVVRARGIDVDAYMKGTLPPVVSGGGETVVIKPVQPAAPVVQQVIAVQQNKPLAVVDASQFPSYFKGKQTKQFCDYLNSIEGADADVRAMYSIFGEIYADGESRLVAVKYTDKNHAVKYSYSLGSGKLVQSEVAIPKFDADIGVASGTTAHELGHFIDLCERDDKGTHNYLTYGKNLCEAQRASFVDGSPRLKAIFDDANKRGSDAVNKVYAMYAPKEKDLSDRISEAIHAHDYAKYDILNKERNKLWSAKEKDADTAIRKEMGGIGSLEDIYDAVTKGHGKLHITMHHGSKYYSQYGNDDAEAFADYCSIALTNPDVLQLLEEEFPVLYQGLSGTVKEILKHHGR